MSRAHVFAIALIFVSACATSAARSAPATASAAAKAADAAAPAKNPTDVKMIHFEGGHYKPAGGRDPETEVTPFLLDQTEVTAAAYDECVKTGACTAAAIAPGCSEGVPAMAKHPINCVNSNQATAYCTWLGKRLPTDAEWEWAARGGPAARHYPWGEDPPSKTQQLCWNGLGNPFGKGQRRTPCPVGSYPRGDTPEGLKDMAGNVQEWTSTPVKTVGRYCRGGAWYYEDDVDFATGRRNQNLNTYADIGTGFRCAKNP